MVSNYGRYSNCTSPTLNKTDDTSHSNRLNLYVDNKPATPWKRGEVIHEGMIPVDKGYIQKNIFGRRYYGNNNMKFYHSGSTGTGGGGGGGGVGTSDGGGGGNFYNYYGRKRGRTYNRHYYHEGQRAYNNNHKSRYPFTCSPTVYPLSRSQSSYNIDSDITNNNNSDDYHYHYKNDRRVHRYSNCSYTMNNEQLTDEYIDDCLSTDIEQYQLKLDMNNQYIHHNYTSKHLTTTTTTNNDMNNVDDWTKVKTSSPSSSTSSSSSSSSSPSPSTDSDFVSNDISQPSSSSSPSASSSPSSSSSSSSNNQIINSYLHNDTKQLQHKCKSSLNLSTSCIIVYDTNNNEDYIDVNHHIHDNVENQRESIEYDNHQKDCKSRNMNDYLTLVWGDLPETLENN
ncbi:unnamed protein product [Schistosoma mattheei]|uniref:Loricrin n=1 Tax=Schistosoma mattheei TaxID=31246 RepID=A0AA85B1M7_9TREM|nr:unnamed protein product [Schistosoma mattheei]